MCYYYLILFSGNQHQISNEKQHYESMVWYRVKTIKNELGCTYQQIYTYFNIIDTYKENNLNIQHDQKKMWSCFKNIINFKETTKL